MRKLIVKYFALDYVMKLFGKKVKFVRAANIIFPLMLLSGVYTVEVGYITESVTGLILLSLLSIALFFGFVYFRLFPAKWDELTESQKWQYGFSHAAVEHRGDWIAINQRLTFKYDYYRFYLTIPILVNIIALLGLILYMVL